MGSSAKTLNRMNDRVHALADDLPMYLRAFEEGEIFTGPSVYFHYKTLEAISSYPSLRAALSADDPYDWLYATLVSWGLHRMGKNNAKLREIDEIRASFRGCAETINRLSAVHILDIPKAHQGQITSSVWQVLSVLRVSIARAQLVANTKALHHFLPELVPPVDREYTYQFFFDRKELTITEEEAFSEMFQGFLKIARENREFIQSEVGFGFNTSPTKVIDNVIVGFVKKELKP